MVTNDKAILHHTRVCLNRFQVCPNVFGELANEKGGEAARDMHPFASHPHVNFDHTEAYPTGPPRCTTGFLPWACCWTSYVIRGYPCYTDPVQSALGYGDSSNGKA